MITAIQSGHRGAMHYRSCAEGFPSFRVEATGDRYIVSATDPLKGSFTVSVEPACAPFTNIQRGVMAAHDKGWWDDEPDALPPTKIDLALVSIG